MLSKGNSSRPGLAMAAATGALLLTTGGAARAQGYTPIYTLDYGNPEIVGEEGTTRAGTRPQNIALALAAFPYVSFYRSGYFPERQAGGTDLVTGQLFATDASLVPHTSKSVPIDLGGWYFAERPLQRSNPYDLYELHARAFASPRRDIGFQAAVLRSTNKLFPGNTYTYFAVTEYSSTRAHARRSGTIWGVQGGLGVFVDPSYQSSVGTNQTTVGPSFFLSGSVDLSNRYNVTLSEWYVRDRELDINRLALGFGYHF